MQITVNAKTFIEAVQKFEKEFPACKFVYDDHNIAESDAVFGGINLKQIDTYKNLKWVQTCTSGMDYYINNPCPANIMFTSATGGYNRAISEYMLATTLSLFQNLHLYRDNQNKNLWQGCGKIRYIKDATVLVVGLGNIGGDYAKLVKAVGGYVIGVKRTKTDKPNYVDELYTPDQLHELLPRADVVAIATPSTKETQQLFDAKAISLMKNNAVILNVGRGNIINTQALTEALESNKLGGAILDVTQPEPLPVDHKLWSMKNVIITPHISGGFGTDETRNAIIAIFKENLTRFLNNQPLVNLIDFDSGYTTSQV